MPATRAALVGALALAAAALTATFGGLVTLDTATREWLIGRRSPDLTAVMIALSTIGSSVVLVPLALGVAVWLGVGRHRREASLVVGTTLGAWLLGPLLKHAVERARPEDAHLVLVNSWAYPSGHSLTSTAVLGVLSVVVSIRLTARTARLATVAAGVILVVLVGISRIYLGVHWPTDVLAGWLIGAGWLAGCLLVYEALERRRLVGE
ncbi:MAG: phosphatase PAP2 family protein [Actinophytocola sp.]|uniref:phosphatase PAP2 family protein n=1 Tax=Actinophytocola sp. TaxID=1872138 RepID=UPI003D6AB46F